MYPVLGYEPAGLQIFQQKEKVSDPSQGKQEEKQTGKSERLKETTEKAVSATTEPKASAASVDVLEDQVQPRKQTGYAIQFGSYSTKQAAENSVSQLKQSGITAEVMEKDGAYKVISRLFDTEAVSYTHLDVYKRQLLQTISAKVRICLIN